MTARLPPQKYHLLIPSRDGARLLVRKTPQELALPNLLEPDRYVKYERLTWTYDSNKFADFVLSAYTIRVYPRRRVWVQPDESGDNYRQVLAVELCSAPSELEKGLEWMSKTEALSATWAHIHPELDIVGAVRELFAEINDGKLSVKRSSWRRPHWFENVCGWAFSVIKSNGLVPENDYIACEEHCQRVRSAMST